MKANSAVQIKQIMEVEKQIKNHQKELAALILKRHNVLEKVKAEKGKSFAQGSRFYQIRNRGKMNYLCSSDVKFGSWLKKS
ncbi:MAG: hypothetical protein RQ856_06415 [Candidatus Izemoplasmatales bacterium]|nr:hypothetical protein [Candidatus Izemoplasmatales bacterium]